MSEWHSTMDEIAEIERASVDLSLDQRIQLVHAKALMSVAQELSHLNPQNTTFRDADGAARNGWGFKTGE